jgi:hypothetical protein
MKSSSRRKFLSDSAKIMGTSAYAFGLSQFVDIMLKNSLAQAQGETAAYLYKYVSLVTSGAPPRWYLDQPLNPENRNFIAGSFGTELVNKNGVWQAAYKSYKQTFGGASIYLPPVWNLKSAASGEAFSSLLKNTLMVRGLNMEINSHPVNRERTVRPFSSNPSITGLVGDKASAPFSSIGHSGVSTTNVYKSSQASAVIAVNRNNPMPGIISPFNTTSIIDYKDLNGSVKLALSQINKYAETNNLSSHGSDVNLARTYDMFEENLASFSKEYTSLVTKYESICKAEMQAEFPGVTTELAKIVPDGSASFSYESGRAFGKNDNLKSILAGAKIPQIAQAFALAEFVLTQNLSSSLSLDTGSSFGNILGKTLSHDQHYLGSITSVLFTSLYFRCYLGCMLEFRKQLVAAKIFDTTVIQTTAEFSRTPKTSASGSDHGFESSSCSITSGMLGDGALIGNIAMNPPADMKVNYAGTWGHAAPFLTDSGVRRNIINDDVVSTVCEMLEVEHIGTKGVTLVKKDSSTGKVSLLYKGAKNEA